MQSATDVMRAMVAMFNSGDLSELDATVGANYLDHQGLGEGPMFGPAGFSAVVEAARGSYETLDVTIEDLIADTDRVAARLRWRGKRTSGEPVERESLEIIQVVDGRAIEHWGGRS